MPTPVVSVVIPAYRSGRLLREAVDSVMDQTLKNFEIILVDNNANEETRAEIQMVLETYSSKIRLIHEPTQGNSSARNRGIMEARGEYIALLDDDDKMYPDRLESQVAFAKDQPEATIIYSLIDVISYDGSRIVIPRLAPTVEFFVRPVMEDHPRYSTDPPLLVTPSVMLFSRERALRAGIFDISYNPCHTEDTDFCFRMWHLGPFKGIDRSLSMYRQASSAFFAKKRQGMVNWYQVRKNQNLFFQKLAELYLDIHDRKNLRKFREVQAQLLRETSHDILSYRDGREMARKLLGRAIQAKPLDYKNWKWFLRTWYPHTQLETCLKREILPTCLTEDVSDLTLFDHLFQLPQVATGKKSPSETG